MTVSGGEGAPVRICSAPFLVSEILLAATLLSCSSPQTRAEGLSVRDSAGVEIVESLRPVWEEGEGWRIGTEPLLRIGVVDGETAYMFTGVCGAGRLSDGTLVVGDGGAQEVRYFDSRGRHVRTVGRSGEGPGEFTGLSMVGVGPGDKVWAYDFSLRRITWYDGEGERTGLTSLGMEPPVLNSVGPLPDGTFLLKQLWGASRVSQARTEGLRRDPVAWVRFHESGALADSLGTFPGSEVFITEENGRGVMNTPPFARHSVGSIRGDRVVVGDQETYTLREYAVSGELQRILRIPDRIEPVEEDDLEEYIQGRLDGEDRARHPAIRESLEGMPVPATLPAYGAVMGDALGNLWVGEWAMNAEVPRDWSVFDGSGRWLGKVYLPEGFAPLAIGEEWILGVERDELDVEYVALYSLVKG